MSGLATFQFDTTIFTVVGDDRVTIGGPTAFATNIIFDDSDGSIYFEVKGLLYFYMVEVQSGKVEIENWYPDRSKRRSITRPRNQSELLEAIKAIGADFEKWLDAVELLIAF